MFIITFIGGLFGKQTSNPTGLFSKPAATTAAPTTGGGLFGSGASTTAAPTTSTGGGLFGAKPATSTTGGGLFGGGSTSTASTGGGLFGSKTASATTTGTSGGLFGSKPATTGTTGAFFGSGSTTTGTSGGLFGSGSTTASASGGLFGSGAATSAAAPTTGLFGQNPQSQGDQSMKHSAEIEAALQTYISQIDPASQKNNFVFCIYNKYGPSVNNLVKEQIKNSYPVKTIASIPANNKISGEATEIKQVEVFINQKKYTKAKRDNPDADAFYVKQVNSYEELYE